MYLYVRVSGVHAVRGSRGGGGGPASLSTATDIDTKGKNTTLERRFRKWTSTAEKSHTHKSFFLSSFFLFFPSQFFNVTISVTITCFQYFPTGVIIGFIKISAIKEIPVCFLVWFVFLFPRKFFVDYLFFLSFTHCRCFFLISFTPSSHILFLFSFTYFPCFSLFFPIYFPLFCFLPISFLFYLLLACFCISRLLSYLFPFPYLSSLSFCVSISSTFFPYKFPCLDADSRQIFILHLVLFVFTA